MNGDSTKPIGHQYALAMLDGGEEQVRSVARAAGTQITMDAFLRVRDEEPVPAFLHSALCAMSLPTKRPKDETQPILREDGKYALAINPRPVLQNVDGKPVLKSLGVPYGAYPRVALIYLLSQAVTKRSRDVYLGRNFTEWMRRLGYQTVSYGPRGTANRMREQVDRLLACEWQIRWDGTEAEDNAFAVRDVKISNEYAGSLEKNGAFAREIRMSEGFYAHLIDHAVPLNEVAIRELKGTPTALDLYTYLAYRLPRIASDGADDLVGPACPPPRQRCGQQTVSSDRTGDHAIGFGGLPQRQCRSIWSKGRIASFARAARTQARRSPATTGGVGCGKGTEIIGARHGDRCGPDTKPVLLAFPSGSLSFGEREGAFRRVGLEKGHPWSVDQMADAFRAGFPGIAKRRTETEWLRVWESFVISYAKRRSNSEE
ncbi:replication protein RepA [Novosphingobium panipatense]